MCRLHRLPVQTSKDYYKDAEHLEHDSQLAAEIAAQIDIILLAMERDPTFKPITSKYNALLW